MEVSQESYDGFANYQTWCVNWWLTNDAEASKRCRELVNQTSHAVQEAAAVVSGIGDAAEATRNLLANELSELVDGYNPVANETTLFSDLIGTALGEVDWLEIADAFLSA